VAQAQLIVTDCAISEARIRAIGAVRRVQVHAYMTSRGHAAVAFLTGALSAIHAAAAAAEAGVSAAAEALLSTTHDAIEGVLAGADAAAEGVSRNIDEIARQITTSAQTAVGAAADRILGIIDSVPLPDVLKAPAMSLVRGAANAVTDGLTTVVSLIQGTIERGVALVQEAVHALGEAAEQLIAAVVSTVESTLQGIIAALEQVVTKAIGKLRGVVLAIVHTVLPAVEGAIFEVLEQGERIVIDQLHRNRDEHLEALAETVAPCTSGPAVAGKGSTLAESLAGIHDLGAEAVRFDHDIVHLFEALTSLRLGAVIEMLAGALGQAFERIAASIAGALEAVGSAVTRVRAAFTQIAGDVAGFVATAIGWLAGGFTEIVASVRAFMQHPADALAHFASGAWSRMKSFLSALVSAVSGGVSSIIGVFSPGATPSGPIVKPTPAPLLFVLKLVYSVLATYVAPALAALYAALVPIVGPEAAFVITIVVGVVVVALILVLALLLLLLLLWLLLKLKPKPKPKPPCTVTTETVALTPAPRTRTRVGVGEEVKLTYSAGSATWTSTVGSVTPAIGPTSMFKAPDIRNAGTVSAVGSCGRVDTIFTVIEPSTWTMDRFPGTGLKHTAGRPDCGWKGLTWFHPDDVNFYNMEDREQDSLSVTTGSYNPLSGQPHGRYPGGFSPWFPMTRHDPARGSTDDSPDSIYSGDPGSASTGTAPPFNPGTMYFPITLQWRVIGLASIHNFGVLRQEHEIYASGKCESRKGGHTESRMYNDPASSW
jgi:phage-related protein